MKTINDVNQVVADQLGIPLKTVTTVNKQYWDHIRYSLANPDRYVYYIPFIGYFYTEPKLLIKAISYNIRVLRAIRSRKTPKLEIAKDSLRKLWKLKQKLGWRLTPNAKKMKKV